MPDKVARKTSQDPRQEELRNHKQEWNSKCSEFIASINAFKPRLIAFKRGLNGRGDAKAGLPPSNIKEPLPGEINNYLSIINTEFSDLVQTFATLASEANGIIQEQAQYSQVRRQPQPRKAPGTTANVYNSADDLIVEGSNPLSRFWAHLSSIFSSDKNKHLRLSMLSTCKELFDTLLEFEDDVLEKGTSNIRKVINDYFLVDNTIKALKLSTEKLLTDALPKSKPQPPISPTQQSPSSPPPFPPSPSPAPSEQSFKDPEDEYEAPADEPPVSGEKITSPVSPSSQSEPAQQPPAPVMVKVKKIPPPNIVLKMRGDIAALEQLESDLGLENEIKQWLKTYVKWASTTVRAQKATIEDILKNQYAHILRLAKQIIKEKTGKDVNSFEEILGIGRIASIQEKRLIKLSGNYLSRLLKRYQRQLGKKDPTSGARLKIYDKIREAKKQTDRIMDILESKIVDPKILLNAIAELEKIAEEMKDNIKILNILHDRRFFDTDIKKQREYLDPTERNIRRHMESKLR